MSYGITDTGFINKDLSAIISDLQQKALEVEPNTDLRATNPLMKFINVIATDIQDLWNTLADVYSNIFIVSATGAALDQLAVDRGIQRQLAVRAVGTVTVTAPAGTIIPGGTVFSTSGDNITYFDSTGTVGIGETTESFNNVTGPPYEITLSAQAEGSLGTNQIQVQIYPTTLTEVASAPSAGEFSVDYSNPTIITLGQDPGSATTTVVYYDASVTSDTISIQARETGISGNVGPAQINTLVSAVSGVTNVTNQSGTTGGENEETDAAFRARLIDIPVAEWTESDLESVIENINGIKSATIDDGEEIETFTDADQSGAGPYTVDLAVNAIAIFRVTHYDDSAGTRTDLKSVSSSPSAGEYRLVINAEPTADQVEYGNFLDTNDTLTVTYMDASIGVGIFKIQIVPDAPPLSSVIIDEIDNVVKSAKPFGVSYFITEPTFSNVSITITVVLDGVYTLSDVTPTITSDISTYISGIGIGDPLRHYEIIDNVMSVNGVVDVTLVSYGIADENVKRASGDTDTTLHTALSLPNSIVDENTISYALGSDYQLVSNLVDWNVNTDSMLFAIQDDGGVFTDETTASNNATADDMNLNPASPADNDAYYFMSKFPFSTLEINISTAGAGVWTIVWEYENAGGWTALASVTDGTANFTSSGVNQVNWQMPSDWVISTVDGNVGYAVRARMTSLTSQTTQPLGQQSWIKSVGTDLTGAVAEDAVIMTTETTASSNLTTDDMNLLPSGAIDVDDAYYFAADTIFANLGINISQAGVGSWSGVWEYSQGSDVWDSLSNVADTTTDFKTAGTHIIDFDVPGDWATDTVNSIAGKYWVRYRVTTGDGAPSTQPLGRISWTGGRTPVKDTVYTISLYSIANDTSLAGVDNVKYVEGTVTLQE